MKNKHILIGLGVLASLSIGIMAFMNFGPKSSSSDDALLAIIKNDQKAFEAFIKNGGDLHSLLPQMDGKTFTVAEGIVYFERAQFLHYLKRENKKFVKQDLSKDYDIVSLAVEKNNHEVMELILSQNPDLSRTYGKNGLSLLHLVSQHCSHKTVGLLHQKGLGLDIKAKDGSLALVLAAQKDCLQVLSYWKDQKADFKAKDANGHSALSVLKGKKDAALVAFAESFLPKRESASAAPEVNFYKKRSFPKSALVDRSQLLEPEDRPEEAIETAEASEFSD